MKGAQTCGQVSSGVLSVGVRADGGYTQEPEKKNKLCELSKLVRIRL